MKKLFFGLSIMLLVVAADAQTTIPKTKPATTVVKPATTGAKPVTTSVKPKTTVLKPVAIIDTLKPPVGDAKPGDWYGEKVTPEGAADFYSFMEFFQNGKMNTYTGKFAAKIIEVCPIDGCWLRLELKDSGNAVVRMKGTAPFFLPLAAKGKKVVIQGTIDSKTVSVAELKQFATHLKKPKKEIDAINEPEKIFSVMAKGIVVAQ